MDASNFKDKIFKWDDVDVVVKAQAQVAVYTNIDGESFNPI